MKKTLVRFALLLAVCSFALPALAHGKKKPCAGVWKACVKAGKKGADAKSCVETIKGGGTVDGVTPKDAAVKACQASAQNEGGSSGSTGSGT